MSLMGGDDLTIHAKVDNDASPELRDIKDDLRGVGVQADRTSRQADRSSRSFAMMGKAGRLAATGLKVAFGATLVAGYAAVRLLTSSFGEAREAQKVGATTAAIIKATGGAAKISEKQVGKLAGRLSVMAGVDDELIQTGANLLLTFKNVRNEAGKGNKVFNRATAAAVDLAAAGFGSVESGSKMLGKALNDPLKGITALSRAGVTFTAQQQEQIKTLVGQNDLLGAQRIILGEVEHQVGGVAKANATWGDKAKVAWGNAQEALGTALLPLLDRVSRWFVEKGAPQLDKWVGIFEDKGIPALGRFGRKADKIGREVLPEVKDALTTIRDVIDDLAPKLVSVFDAFKGLPKWAKQAIVLGAGGAIVAKKVGALSLGGKVASTVAGLATKAKPVPVWVVNPGMGGGPMPKGSKLKSLLGLGEDAAVGGGVAVALRTALSRAVTRFGPLAFKKTDSQDTRTAKIVQATAPRSGPTISQSRSYASASSLLLGPMGGQAALTAASAKAQADQLEAATTSAKRLRKELRGIGTDDTVPKVATTGITPATRAALDLGHQLRGLSTTTFTARADLDASAAYASLARLRSAAAYGAQAGVPNAARTGMEPRAYGGRVIAGRSYLVGERRAETFTPDRSGWIKPRASVGDAAGGGGITIEAGAILVDASGASSNVDVAEAVQDGIEAWFREREERG